MRKYIFNGLAALIMGLAISSCMKEFSFEEQEQQASLDNAQQTLGFYIPANQDWVMTTTATATFNVKGLSDEATLYVFSNNPHDDGSGTVLASSKMTGTTTTISDFRIPSYLTSVYVGLRESNGNMVYKYVDVENGQIIANYDYRSAANSRTRANAVVNGDPFTFENTNSYYKTTADIPSDAKDINTSSDYDCVMSGKLVATSDMRSNLNLWQGPAVDIYINGVVTIPAGAYIHSANIYVLPGSTLTVYKQANYGCKIYVSEKATLNYYVSKLETNNDGTGRLSSIYSRGTVRFADNFEANQDVIIYNEGTMIGKDITSKPGDGNPSYFYNFGDLTLSGKMELNSKSNFYNEGTVSVSGLTEATQANIWWINKGHYTTGSLKMTPWNETFYNYCNLIVNGSTQFYNGKFHLMDNAYIQTSTLEVINFTINMGSNAGFNCTGDNSWGGVSGQGDGLYNGFICNGSNSYVCLGGTTTVAGHIKALETTGNITIAVNSINDLGLGNSGVQPTYIFNEGKEEVTFGTITPTYTTTDCGATWNGTPSVVVPPTENNWWTYAFEDNKTRCDFDMNDVVIQVKESETDPSMLIVKLVAAGCQYDNYVWLGDDTEPIKWPNGAEVHEAFGADHGDMVNTGRGEGKEPVVTTIAKPTGFVDLQNAAFKIRPYKINSERTEANAVSDYITIANETTKGEDGEIAKAPLGIAIPAIWKWPTERTIVTEAYPTPDDNSHHGFATYGSEEDPIVRIGLTDWYKYPVDKYVYNK